MKVNEIKVRQNGKAGAEFIQYTTRFPPRMYERVRDEATKSGRSLHAEILHRIALTLGDDFMTEDPQGASTLDEMAKDIKEIRNIAEAFLAARRQV